MQGHDITIDLGLPELRLERQAYIVMVRHSCANRQCPRDGQ